MCVQSCNPFILIDLQDGQFWLSSVYCNKAVRLHCDQFGSLCGVNHCVGKLHDATATVSE